MSDSHPRSNRPTPASAPALDPGEVPSGQTRDDPAGLRASDGGGTGATDARHEQRRDARITINKEFSSFDAFVDEYVTNVSRSGAFVKSSDPLPVGTQINLCFTVITDEFVRIEGVGEVVRVVNDPPGMGVVFTRVDQHSKQLLERLIVGRRS